MQELRLRPVRIDDEAPARRAHEVMAADDFKFLLSHDPDEPWSRYVGRLADQRRGLRLRPQEVAATFLLAVIGPTVVGRTSVRHKLNDYLAAFGGHVGYGVLPEHRRRGYAAEILRQSLVVARAVGVDRVLVTCDDSNVASATVIERCGGVLESVVIEPEGSPLRRYWSA